VSDFPQPGTPGDQDAAGRLQTEVLGRPLEPTGAEAEPALEVVEPTDGVEVARRRNQLKDAVVGEQLRLRSRDPSDVGRIERLIVDRLTDDQPLDLRERQPQARRHHLVDVVVRQRDGQPALREVGDRRADQRFHLTPVGGFERPGQSDALELVRDRGVRPGDDDRLADALREGELLEMSHDHAIVEVRTQVVEHEHGRRL
jgi:hypothetical protein